MQAHSKLTVSSLEAHCTIDLFSPGWKSGDSLLEAADWTGTVEVTIIITQAAKSGSEGV